MDLDKLVLLDPEWLADVAATVVTVTEQPASVETPWKLTAANREAIWKSYPVQDHAVMLELLYRFEAAYKGPGGTTIVPAMFPDKIPIGIDWSQFDNETRQLGRAACVKVKLSHLPLHLFPRLVARLQDIATVDQGDHGAWKTGVVLCDHRDAQSRCLLWQPQPRHDPCIVEVW